MLTQTKNNLLSLSILSTSILLTGCGSSNDKNTAPTVSGEIIVATPENTTAVAQYIAEDIDGDGTFFSLNGTDSDLFTIDADGNLSFINAPDYDSGEVGPYNVIISVTDDHESPLSTDLNVQITIGNEVDTPAYAAVQTVYPGYNEGSEVVFVDGYEQQVSSAYYYQQESDFTISLYNTDIFHIGRWGIDTITKYDTEAPENSVWSYSTLSDQETTKNPHTLVSLSDTKAYLIRYGSDKVWIVDPSATQESDFKIGELDLSSYVNDDTRSGTPSPSAGVILDDKLYVIMQRLSPSWKASNSTYIAVFDVTTDEEIETNTDDTDDVKGIALAGKNPLEGSLTVLGESIYVSTQNDRRGDDGTYASVDLSFSCIEEINTSDYTVREVICADTASIGANTYFKQTVIVSAEQGYVVSGQHMDDEPYSIDSLYEFNPTTGVIIENNVANSGSESISYIALDTANYLWVSVSDANTSGVDIINTQTNEKIGSRLLTQGYAKTILFID